MVKCAQCGKPVIYRESYTSRTIHSDYGFGYAVCPECYLKEWEEEGEILKKNQEKSIAIKWDWDKRDFVCYELPSLSRLSMTNKDVRAQCASCGCTGHSINFEESITIYGGFGFPYLICQACAMKEREARRGAIVKFRDENAKCFRSKGSGENNEKSL